MGICHAASVLTCLLDLWRQQWPGPIKRRLQREKRGEDRRCPSEESAPSGSPVALLVSLSHLGVDGDGGDEPQLEQNH